MLTINNISGLKQLIRQINLATPSQLNKKHTTLCIIKTVNGLIYFAVFNSEYNGFVSVNNDELDTKGINNTEPETYWFNLQDFNDILKYLENKDTITIASKLINPSKRLYLNAIQINKDKRIVVFAANPIDSKKTNFSTILNPNLTDFKTGIENINKTVKKTFLDLSNFVTLKLNRQDNMVNLNLFSFNNENIYHVFLHSSEKSLKDDYQTNYLIDKSNMTKILTFIKRNKDKDILKLLLSDNLIRIMLSNSTTNESTYIDVFLLCQDSDLIKNIGYLNLYPDNNDFDVVQKKFEYSNFLKKKDVVAFEAEQLPVLQYKSEKSIYKVRKNLFSGYLDLIELTEK